MIRKTLNYRRYCRTLFLVPIAFLVSCTGPVHITETTDEGQHAYKITTPSATYFYQSAAGGFSSMLDRNGNDWIGYRSSGSPSYPASAASDYRGLPNLVFRGENDGAGHPGFLRCKSIAEGNTIETRTRDNLWAWNWEFFDRFAVLTVTRTDTSRNYWFLYEGTPGGRFETEEISWGTSADGRREDKPDYYGGGVVSGKWNHVFFSDPTSGTTLFLVQMQGDTLTDIMGFLGSGGDPYDPDGMVVFGFGRTTDAQPLLGPEGEKFMAGFYPAAVQTRSDYEEFLEYLTSILTDYQTGNTL